MMIDTETTTGNKNYRMHEHGERNLPEGLDVPYEKLPKYDHSISSGEIKERVDLLMSEIDKEFIIYRHYGWAMGVFIALMIVSLFLPFIAHMVLWVGSFICLSVIFFKSNRVNSNIRRRQAFIDGMFFSLMSITDRILMLNEEEKEKPK